MFRLTLLLVEVVGVFFSGNQTQAAAPSLLSHSIALQHKHRHTEMPVNKTTRHHRLKLDAQFLYCRELDLPYQLTRTTSPQVPNFAPSSLLFYVSNFCSSSKKPPKLYKVVRGWENKAKKKTPKPHTQKTACHANLARAWCRGSSSDRSIRTYHHHHSRFMSSLCTVFTGLMDSLKIRNIPPKQQKHQLKAVLGGFWQRLSSW